MSGAKIIFAGLARDVAPFLEAVTRNIEGFAAQFSAWAVLVVENDSQDGSKPLLKSWMEKARQLGAVRARLIEMDGLALSHPVRTDRIAVARNRILQEIEQDKEIGRFDYLAVMDMDFPNSCPLPAGDFRKAIDFLDDNSNVAGVFPNSLPLYYDIWALRAKDWCPGDCWEEVARAQLSLSLEAATEKYVYARQRFIEPSNDPIEVELAFGGIGLYRLKFLQGKRYSGLTSDGSPVCEHAAFHASVRHEGATFFILPFFRNLSAPDHTNLFRTHTMMSLGAASILVDKDVAARYAHYSRSGERFAELAALYSSEGGETVFDLAPQNGALLVQARSRGCKSFYVCMADDDRELAVLCANALMQEQLFANHFLGSGSVGLAKRPGLVRLGNAKDASRMVSLPVGENPWVLWARMEGPDEAADWTVILDGAPSNG